MERKRDGFVPLGDVVDGLSLPGGRALTHRAAAPLVRHHFTTLQQVNQLVAASEADADLGFMARMLALCCSLPRTDPGQQQRIQYVRLNGPFTLLVMIAGGGLNKLPYGNFPRLLAGVGVHRSGTDAKPCAHPWAHSLSAFMRAVGRR